MDVDELLIGLGYITAIIVMLTFDVGCIRLIAFLLDPSSVWGW